MKIIDIAKKIAPHAASFLMLSICLTLAKLSRSIDDVLIDYSLYASMACLLLLILVFKLYYLALISLVAFFLLPSFHFPYFLKYYDSNNIENYYHISQNGTEIYAVKYKNNSAILFEKNGENITCTGKYKHLNGRYCREMFEPVNNFVLSRPNVQTTDRID